MRLRWGFVAATVMVLPQLAFTQSGVIGRKSLDGRIRFEALEDFQISGSRKVLLMPADVRTVMPGDSKHYTKEELFRIGMVRADASHRPVRLNASGKVTAVILPENFASKAPVDAGTVPGRLDLEAFSSRKSKNGEQIVPEEFFVYLAGTDADRITLNFVSSPEGFDNLDEQLEAMRGFAASFPASPLKTELRSTITARVANGLAAFEDGGPYADLLVTRKYALLGTSTFSGDVELARIQKTILDRIQMVETTQPILRSLAASGDWDTLLEKYIPFERYQWSFPDMVALRHAAMQESAHLHSRRARLLADVQQHAIAIPEIATAARRDPDNTETTKLLESEKVVQSQIEARRNAGSRRILPQDSPEDRRFKRSLYNAERAIQEKDFVKAGASIREAEGENPGAPEILIVRALLLAAFDHHADALPLLDEYDRSVVDAAERTRGASVRDQILFELDKKRTALKQELAALERSGEYTKLRAAAAKALELDRDDDDFLYYGGVMAATFRDNAGAKQLLDRYLTTSNALRGDLKRRDRAFRILAAMQPRNVTKASGTPNWFSGKPLAEGIFYCPESAAFQLPVESISGYKMQMNFQWDGGKLSAITSMFDDEKGLREYRGMGSKADPPGNFFFHYLGADPQVQMVSAQKPKLDAGLSDLRVAHDSSGAHLVDAQGTPRIVLAEHSQFNVGVITLLEGPVATGVAGNSFFNPFIWDGIHYFSLSFDSDGRLAAAREWNTDNLVRFSWSGDRLMEVRAWRKDSDMPYYLRTISYSGPNIVSESYSAGLMSGRIKYVYTGKTLQQIRVEDGGVHGGKTWVVRLRP